MDFETIRAQLAVSTNKSISQELLTKIILLKLKKNIMGLSLEENIVNLVAEIMNSGLEDEQADELLKFLDTQTQAAIKRTKETVAELFGQKKEASAETNSAPEEAADEEGGEEE